MENIEERVKIIISEHLGVELELVTETALFEELGADSLDTVELAMGFEDEFDIEIEYELQNKIKTVADAIAIIYESS